MIFQTPPPDFKKRFDIVGCFLEHDGKFVLLHRHDHKASGGKWGLPAGKMDEGETPQEAVLREIKEETGLQLPAAQVRYHSSRYVRDGDFDIEWHMFGASLAEKPEITVNPYEHSEFRWVTPAEALRMDNLIHDLDGCIKLFYDMNPTSGK